MNEITCFKAYDVRGLLGTELNEMVAERIGYAFATYLKRQNNSDNHTIILGSDIRPTSKGLKMALAEGIMSAGFDVIDIGLVGTEEIYFATNFLEAAGGIEVTASHNPIEYNGLKFCKENAKPMSLDDGLDEIKKIAEMNDRDLIDDIDRGSYAEFSNEENYIDHLMSYIEPSNIKPLKLVMNAGNGVAGHIADALEAKFKAANMPIEMIKIFNDADGSFPNGIPNPMIEENRLKTSEAVKAHGADLGIAWDGDFDRCFFFDENGDFIDGYYIVGLLAQAFLAKNNNEAIVYDAKLIWNSEDMIASDGGKSIISKSGHSFIKQKMREHNAIYGGEISAHYYFRDFAYCDSGMIPWLLMIELLSTTGQKMSELIKDRQAKFPNSGEINLKIADSDKAIANVLAAFEADAEKVDRLDGISVEFENWRFNLRCSNTEPLVRLNVETKGDQSLLDEKTKDILAILEQS